MKKIKIRKLLLTIFLWIVLVTIIFSFIAVYIRGPILKNKHDQQVIEDKISESNKNCTITRNSFKYVSYTCENTTTFIVFDRNGEEVGRRKKKDARFDEVEKIVQNYPALVGQPVHVTFGYDSVVYLIEKGTEILVIDFDSLKILMYSGG